MVSQPHKDTPFGMEPNLAAGLAYLLGIIGGVVMLVGGGTNKFVRWAACQSITLWAAYFVFWIVLAIVNSMIDAMHLYPLWAVTGILGLIAGVLAFVAWLWTWITGFQGKEVHLPVIGDLTRRFFAQQLG